MPANFSQPTVNRGRFVSYDGNIVEPIGPVKHIAGGSVRLVQVAGGFLDGFQFNAVCDSRGRLRS